MSEQNTSKLRWGILSTGNIARTFARALPQSQTGTLHAVASRTQQSADVFAKEFGAAKAYASYDALLADPEVDAVYIATPHPLHASWAIKAANAGKHILCEKPLTLNFPETQRVVEAARRNGVALLEAFMYRCHPQTARIVELVQSGALGRVKAIEATFSFQSPFNPASRIYSLELGGGGILDVGCYVASFCRLVAGAATGTPFAEPLELKALGVSSETGADAYTAFVARFPGDILAQGQTGVNLNGGGSCRIIGEDAILRVPSPWFCAPTGRESETTLHLERGGKVEDIFVPFDRPLYAFEADALAQMVATKEVPRPAMGPDDSLCNARFLDLWRAQIGLVYPQERGEGAPVEPLQVRSNEMRFRELPGVVNEAKQPNKVSQIVMGTMLEGAIEPYSHGLSLFDDFFERGGTCFDTARIYGGGLGEKVVGRWLSTRGVRDEVTLLVKGAHPPACTPDGFRRELRQSLDALGVESGDIYMLHRDNLDIPVAEWVDSLSEGVAHGLFRAYGGSNWSLERLDEANAYAKSKGVPGFSGASNNFSLARMVDPVWSGCISSSDKASRAWFESTQTALFSWSSQARGFFARADRAFTSDGELVRCWYSDDNFERLNRATQLAKQRGVSPVVVAAAYVLTQPFPIFALIGPRTLAETRDSFEALELQLSPEECAWLNLES